MTSSSPMQAKFQTAQQLHLQGRLVEAARLYEELLAADAGHAPALHWLGVIAYQTGDLAKALDLISRSVAIDPQSALAHSNLGNVLAVLGRLDESLASYDRALALRPGHADSHNHRGNVLNNLRRFDEALDDFARAIALRPDYAEAHSNLGVALYDLGRFEDALESCNRAIALQPDLAEAHHNRSLVLRELKHFAAALASADRAIRLRPDYAQAHSNRGIVLARLGRLEEAMASYDRAIALEPGFADTHFHRGAALCDLWRHEEALAACDRAIALGPGLGLAHGNRALALQEMGRFDEAMSSHDKAVALAPDCAEVHANRAVMNLRLGRYEGAWEEFEWRLPLWQEQERQRLLELSPDALRRPRLKSLDEARGQTILVHWEQGLGDTIQFCRYVELLQGAGAEVVLAPQPKLRALLTSLRGAPRLVTPADAPTAFDCHVSLMSLPMIFSTTIETIPADIPYLSASEEKVEKWRARLSGEGFRVGVCWQGSKINKRDPGRSFAATRFQGLARIPGVRLISLQKGEKAPETLPGGATMQTLGSDFDSGPDAFVDAAAVMMHLDLVITADTAIAHLAGALGVRTWVALPFVPDWRWMLNRSDSPWYPGMRLFRQAAAGDWDGVFAQMQAALAAELA